MAFRLVSDPMWALENFDVGADCGGSPFCRHVHCVCEVASDALLDQQLRLMDAHLEVLSQHGVMLPMFVPPEIRGGRSQL